MEHQYKGLIFDSQGHSGHDGPGARTVVFLSGCPLRCSWCANPEGLQLREQLMFRSQSCKTCPKRCLAACLRGAVHERQHGQPLIEIDRTQCADCETRQCLKVCYMGALQLSGQWYSVEELMHVLQRDRNYWGLNGGLSLSGGEPLVQIGFVVQLLRRCNESCITACIETSAHVPRENIEAILPFVQWLFIDLKHMDTTRHRSETGVGNEIILRNIEWIAHNDWRGRLMLRMPVVPSFNDSMKNALATAAFMNHCGLNELNLLPFHRLGASKYERLGMQYRFKNVPATKSDDLLPLAKIYREMGINCYLGSDTPF